MDIKVIAFDLDDTALWLDHNTFTKETKEAFLEAHQRGITLLPVTGRPYTMRPEAIDEMRPYFPLGVFSLGAEIRDMQTEELLYSKVLPKEEIIRVAELCKQKGWELELGSFGKQHMTKVAQAYREENFKKSFAGKVKLAFRRTIPEVIIEDSLTFAKETKLPIDKMNIRLTENQEDNEVIRCMKDWKVSVARTNVHFFEVTAEGVDKGQGLNRACQMLGLSIQNAIAFGDSGNDIPMLKSAGFSVAMQNAQEEVKAIAKAITDTNENNGVAKAIRRYVLNDCD